MTEFRDIIVDMDGTLANVKERVAKATENPPPGKRMDWELFLDPEVVYDLDAPNHHVVHLVKTLIATGHRIIVTSARNERHRPVTERQLRDWGIEYEKLYLRKDRDFRKDSDVKAEIFQQMLADGYAPKIAIDDRNQVVDKWRELGIHCWQVEVTDV